MKDELTKVPNRGLSWLQLVSYGLPWFFVQLAFLPLINFIPGYYASDLGIPLMQVSGVLLAARVIDVLTDPILGYLSDHSNNRLGKRKFWILVGLPIFMVGVWFLFVPPANASSFYMFGAVSATFFGLTAIQISLTAWGAQLSDDHNDKNLIVGIREAIGMLGVITAISTPLIAALFGYPLLGTSLLVIAVVVIFTAPIMTLPSIMLVPDSQNESCPQRHSSFYNEFRTVLSNRSFRMFGTALFCIFVGLGPSGALGYILFKDVLNAEALFPLSMLTSWVAALAGLPLWLRLSLVIGKRQVLITALAALSGINLFWPIIVWFDLPPVYAVLHAGCTGAALGAVLTLPYSIVAEIVERDEELSGRSRAGIFMAVSGMILKIGIMLGVAIGLVWPALFGFEAGGPDNTSIAELHVAIGAGWIASLFLGMAASLLFFCYPKEGRSLFSKPAS